MIKQKMKVGEKGQVVIPKIFRKAFGIGPGSKITFKVEDNRLVIEKSSDAVKVFEKIAKTGKHVKKIHPHEYEKELEERWERAK